MNVNTEALKVLARDLRKEDPRPAEERLAGYESGVRCLDKCRASLLGWQGDYTYGCPLDQMFLNEAGLDANEFRDFVATGASDEEVAQWVSEHAHPVEVF